MMMLFSNDDHHSPSSLYLAQQTVTNQVCLQLSKSKSDNIINTRIISKLWILFCESLREDIVESLSWFHNTQTRRRSSQKIDNGNQQQDHHCHDSPLSFLFVTSISIEIPSIGLLEIRLDKIRRFISPSAEFISFLGERESSSTSLSLPRSRSNSPSSSRAHYKHKRSKSQSRYEEKSGTTNSKVLRTTFSFQKFAAVVQTILSFSGNGAAAEMVMTKENIIKIIKLCFEVVLLKPQNEADTASLDLNPIGSLHVSNHRSLFHLSREFSEEVIDMLSGPRKLAQKSLEGENQLHSLASSSSATSSHNHSSFISRVGSSSVKSREQRFVPLQALTNSNIKREIENQNLKHHLLTPPLLSRVKNGNATTLLLTSTTRFTANTASSLSSSSVAVKSTTRKGIEDFLKKQPVLI